MGATASADLANIFDLLNTGIVVCDLGNRTLYSNAALERVLACDPESPRISRAVRRVARLVTRAVRTGESVPGEDGGISLVAGDFRIRGAALRSNLFCKGPCVLVALESRVPEIIADPALRRRYGFSKQEARVAQLLARRYSNREIASTFGISPHTARHHTEHVLLKLGVHSRREARALVLQTTTSG